MKTIKRNTAFIFFIITFASIIILVAFASQPDQKTPDSSTATRSESALNKPEILTANFPYNIGPSHTCKNLQLFFLSTDKNIINKAYMTLSEAMKKKYVTVFETENVNQLSVENLSEYFIFICSGDIVKGGKQDRTIGKDIILPPKSGKVPLASFCVESGRWQQRGVETQEEFNSSNYLLSSRDLKIAAKKSKNQSEVWKNVSKQQEKVNENMVKHYDFDASFDVRDNASETSLQLTLENKELQKVKSEYEKFFKDLNFDNEQTVGFAYAVNGEIYGIDIFYNYKLFKDLWPKLLDAVVVEAISDFDSIEFKPATNDDIVSLVVTLHKNKSEVEKEEINSETTYIITSTDKVARFETLDKRENSNLIHLNYISIDSDYSSTAPHDDMLQENYQIRRR